MKKMIPFLLLIILFSSCIQNEFQEVLFRTTENPTYCIPHVDSLATEDMITISWDFDPAADSYILRRAIDAKTLNFLTVYEGTETSFVDECGGLVERYVYRLDKKRGKKLFIGKEYGYGFAFPIRRDNCENNDSEASAVLLESDLNCNMPCVKYLTNNIIYTDEDWFKVMVPPHRKANVVINQDGLNDGKDTYIWILVPGNVPKKVKQNNAIVLSNPSERKEEIKFKLYPDVDSCMNAEEYLSAIVYTVALNSIFKN